MLHWLLQNTCVTDGDAHMAPHHVRVAQDFKIAEAVEACQTDSDEEEHDQQVLAMMMPRTQIYESGPDTKEGAPRTFIVGPLPRLDRWELVHDKRKWSKHGGCGRQFEGDQEDCIRAIFLYTMMTAAVHRGCRQNTASKGTRWHHLRYCTAADSRVSCPQSITTDAQHKETRRLTRCRLTTPPPRRSGAQAA